MATRRVVKGHFHPRPSQRTLLESLYQENYYSFKRNKKILVIIT